MATDAGDVRTFGVVCLSPLLKEVGMRVSLAVWVVTLVGLVAERAWANDGCYFVNDPPFSADPTGATASDAALATVLSAIGTGNGCVQFGPGTYRFNSQLAISLNSGTKNSITIRGRGSSVTTLHWPNASGGILVGSTGFNTVKIEGLRLTTGVAAGGNAISLTNSTCINELPSYVDDVVAMGSNFPGSFYWTRGLNVSSLSYVNVSRMTVRGSSSRLGDGVYFAGAPGCSAIVLNIAQSNFLSTYVGVWNAAYAQGLTVTQSNFTNGQYGIADQSGTVGQSQLTVSDSQFNVTVDGIVLNSNEMNSVFIHHNAFVVPSNHSGLVINQPSGANGGFGYMIHGNIFQPLTSGTGSGVVVFSNHVCPAMPASCGMGNIVGNVFNNVATSVALSGANAQGWSVQSNSYNNAPLPSNSGTRNTIGGGSP